VQAALAERLAGSGHAQEAAALAAEALAANPEDPRCWLPGAPWLRRRVDFAGALVAASREAELGVPAPALTLVRLALAAQDRGELERVRARLAATEQGMAASLAAFLDRTARESDLLALAPLAVTEAARRFVAQALAPASHRRATLPPCLPLPAIWRHGSLNCSRCSPESCARLRPCSAHVGRGHGRVSMRASHLSSMPCVAPRSRAWGVTPTTATINVLRFGPFRRVACTFTTAGSRTQRRRHQEFRCRPGRGNRRHRAHGRDLPPFVRVAEDRGGRHTGTNSLRPEHERVARAFLVEADAIVWVFSLARPARRASAMSSTGRTPRVSACWACSTRRIQAGPDQVAVLLGHVKATLGDRVEALVPLSARDALAAQLVHDDVRLEASGLPAVRVALQERFFQHTHALKQRTASAALACFADQAGELCRTARPTEEGKAQLVRRRADLDASEARVRAALASERLNLVANLDDGFRRAATETLAMVQPRTWPLGDAPPGAADEDSCSTCSMR